jgi:hypothetical protein
MAAIKQVFAHIILGVNSANHCIGDKSGCANLTTTQIWHIHVCLCVPSFREGCEISELLSYFIQTIKIKSVV